MSDIIALGALNKSSSSKEKMVEILGIHYAAHQQYRPHYDRQGRISIVLRGMVQERVCKREEIGTSLSVVVKPNSVLHSNAFGKDGAFLVSVLLTNEFQARLGIESFFEHWQWWHADQTARLSTEFLQSLQLDHDLESTVVEFVAGLNNNHFMEGKHVPPWLARICDKIEEECFNPPTVAELAWEAGVHPVYLARVFRKFRHCNIKSYLHRCRMRRINWLLSENRLPIAQIAFESGYADQSHLTRYYKRLTGITPAAFRRLVQGF